MRVSCKSCGTEYVVSDARVAGRERSAHCGKCHTTFVIDGRGMCVPSTGGTADERWIVRHYTQSELDTGELRAAVENGSLPARGTVVWRRGMADWMPVMSVEEVSRGVAAPPRSASTPGSPAPPSVSTLDMALSQTESSLLDAREAAQANLDEGLEDEIDGTRTPAPADSPLSAAILSVSTPPEPTVVVRRAITVPRLRQPASRPAQSPPMLQGAVAIARIEDEPSAQTSGVSGARRIDLSRAESWRAPVSGRSPSGARRMESLPEDTITPESVRPMSSRSTSPAAEAERGARAATRLSLMAAAGFLGCLALLHQFSGEPEERAPEPPALPPAGALRASPAPLPEPARATAPAPSPEVTAPTTASPQAPPSLDALQEAPRAPTPPVDPPAAAPARTPTPPLLEEPAKPTPRAPVPRTPKLQELVPFDAPEPKRELPRAAEPADPNGE